MAYKADKQYVRGKFNRKDLIADWREDKRVN